MLGELVGRRPGRAGRYSPFRHLGAALGREAPVHLTVFLTRRCNAGCPFCFYRASGGEAGSGAALSHGAPELSLREFSRAARTIGPLLWLAFSGGEIFLRPDLADVVQAFYHSCRPAIILLLTNGLLSERIARQVEEVLRRCPRSTVAVKLSLDGPARMHDRLRGVPDAFDRVMATYHRLVPLLHRYANFELGVNTVLCAANQEQVEETIALVRELPHCRTHTVSLVRGRIGDPALAEVDAERYRQAARLLACDLRAGRAGRYRFPGGRLKAAQDIVQRRRIADLAAGRPVQFLPCVAGRLSLTLIESGEVFACESFEERFLLGNLREAGYDLGAILRSARAKAVRQRIRETRCVCTHECYQMLNILFTPLAWPAVAREYLGLFAGEWSAGAGRKGGG